MHLAIIITATVVAGVIIDRVLLVLEDRGLIYYRRVNVRGAAGAALATLQEFVEPHAAAIVETTREQDEHEDDDDDGDKRTKRL
jgi:hypothetical protein